MTMDNTMKTASAESLARYVRAMEFAASMVSAIKPEQWHNATPCDERDLRVLVNHIIGENRWIHAVLGGRTLERVWDELNRDLTGDDPIAAYADSMALAKSVLTPAQLAGPYKLSFGLATGIDCVTQMFMDQLVHSWDIIKGSGQSVAFDDELVAAAIPVAEEKVAAVGQGSVFGYTQAVVPDESELDLLLG